MSNVNIPWGQLSAVAVPIVVGVLAFIQGSRANSRTTANDRLKLNAEITTGIIEQLRKDNDRLTTQVTRLESKIETLEAAVDRQSTAIRDQGAALRNTRDTARDQRDATADQRDAVADRREDAADRRDDRH